MYNIIDTIFVSLYHMKILTYKKGVSFLLINGKNETIKEDTKPFPTFTLVVVFSNMYISKVCGEKALAVNGKKQ